MSELDRPDAAAWAERLNLRRRGGEFVGPCPLCGGEDRFHVADKSGRPGLAGCRKCGDGSPDWYRDALRAAGFEQRSPERRRKRRTRRKRPVAPAGSRSRRPERLSEPRPASGRDAERIERARKLIAASEPLPADPEHPARQWRGGLIEAAADALRWLPAERLRRVPKVFPAPGAAGAILAPVGGGDACQLVYVGPDGKPAQDAGKPPLNKRSYGPTGGACWWTREPEPGGVVLIAEGVADALALARYGWPCAASLSAGGMHACALLELIERLRLRPIFCADRDDDGAGLEAARTAVEAVRRDGRAALIPWPADSDPGSDPEHLRQFEAKIRKFERADAPPTAASNTAPEPEAGVERPPERRDPPPAPTPRRTMTPPESPVKPRNGPERPVAPADRVPRLPEPLSAPLAASDGPDPRGWNWYRPHPESRVHELP